jgi:hypothetical protein
MPSGPPTAYEIRKIARRTISIIENRFEVGSVCLIGSGAAALWTDIGRVPNVCTSFPRFIATCAKCYFLT